MTGGPRPDSIFPDMNKFDSKPIWKTGNFLLLLLLMAFAGLFLAGCAGPEGGSSIPWAEPEPWENQPTFGVPY